MDFNTFDSAPKLSTELNMERHDLKHFLRFGFLCRHAFCALKNRDVQMIPEKYILRLWRRDMIPPALRRNTNIKKPEKPKVKNPSKASTKGWSKESRRKSGREIALEETSKRKRKCGFCGEKTNKHTKMTCPLNPNYIAKLARIAAAQKDGTDASEQATRNVVAEQATNAS
ncbi:Zinc finger, SWIM-type [Artemisia annua]|uniref:Zinc finger, SWIM-type n=1 Tax=Artemisia annua TaxID=35608 RepID=A0A2U1MCG3_ARTAN|nr:Zinc finger, SWIM-type [Artemisia annua]